MAAGNRSLSVPGLRSKPFGATAIGFMTPTSDAQMGQHIAAANERAMNTADISEQDMLMANSVAPGVQMQQTSYMRSPSKRNVRMDMTM